MYNCRISSSSAQKLWAPLPSRVGVSPTYASGHYCVTISSMTGILGLVRPLSYDVAASAKRHHYPMMCGCYVPLSETLSPAGEVYDLLEAVGALQGARDGIDLSRTPAQIFNVIALSGRCSALITVTREPRRTCTSLLLPGCCRSCDYVGASPTSCASSHTVCCYQALTVARQRKCSCGPPPRTGQASVSARSI